MVSDWEFTRIFKYFKESEIGRALNAALRQSKRDVLPKETEFLHTRVITTLNVAGVAVAADFLVLGDVLSVIRKLFDAGVGHICGFVNCFQT